MAGAPRYRVAYSTTSSMSGATYKRVTANSWAHRAEAGAGVLREGPRHHGGRGNLSPYSKAVKATTQKGYSAPAGCRGSAGSTSVALRWGSRGSGLTYRVQWADNAAMSGASYKRFTATSGTISGLAPRPRTGSRCG